MIVFWPRDEVNTRARYVELDPTVTHFSHSPWAVCSHLTHSGRFSIGIPDIQHDLWVEDSPVV